MITVTIQRLFSYTDPNMNKAFRDLAFWGERYTFKTLGKKSLDKHNVNEARPVKLLVASFTCKS